jgi:hypothetical protein
MPKVDRQTTGAAQAETSKFHESFEVKIEPKTCNENT